MIHNCFIDNLDTEQEVDIGVLDLVGIDECSLACSVDEIVVLDSEGTADLDQSTCEYQFIVLSIPHTFKVSVISEILSTMLVLNTTDCDWASIGPLPPDGSLDAFATASLTHICCVYVLKPCFR
jgi:hypothetical protein